MPEESKMRISLFICLSLVGSQVLSLESRDELFARLEACGEILGPLKRLGCFEQILEKENAAEAYFKTLISSPSCLNLLK